MLAAPILTTLFQYGEFSPHDVDMAARSLLAFAFGGSVTLLGFASDFATGLGAILLVGACSAGFQSLNNALTLSFSASRYHGRVQSLTMLSWSLFGIASMPIGVVADAIGIRETLMIAGARSSSPVPAAPRPSAARAAAYPSAGRRSSAATAAHASASTASGGCVASIASHVPSGACASCWR